MNESIVESDEYQLLSNLINELNINSVVNTDIKKHLNDDDDLLLEEVYSFNADVDEIEVSNFFSIDPFAGLSEEELDEPTGDQFWTDKRIIQFCASYLIFTGKRLFNPHVSNKTRKELLDWAFNKPIYKNQDRVQLFSFQHLCIVSNCCPYQVRTDWHSKACITGLYEKMDRQVEIVRTRRDISLTYKTDTASYEKMHAQLLKLFNKGELPWIKTPKQLKKLLDKNFRERTALLQQSDDLFSPRNVATLRRY